MEEATVHTEVNLTMNEWKAVQKLAALLEHEPEEIIIDAVKAFLEEWTRIKTVTIRNDVWEALAKLAVNKNMSVSRLANMLLENSLRKHGEC